MSRISNMLMAVRITKILTIIIMFLVAIGMAAIITFAISDLSNYDPGLSHGEVILETYQPREIITTADGHRMVDKPGYWYIRVEGENGEWREVRLHEWQTMHVNVGDWVIVKGDYDVERIGA